MIVFKCILTEDEMFSDSLPFKLSDDGIWYIVTGRFTSEKFELDESKIGGNASAEEVCEGAEDVTVSGIDVVINGKLQKTHWLYNEKNKLDRKQVLSQLKEYFKKIIATIKDPEAQAEFKAKSEASLKKYILSNLKEFDIYTGESNDADGGLAFLTYEDDDTPLFYFLKAGLVQEKY